MSVRRGRAWLLACVAVVGLAGCSGVAPSDALASLDEGGATVCTPADAAGRAVIGISAIANTSASSLSVTGAELVDASDMTLIGLELRSQEDQRANVVGADYDDFGPARFEAPVDISPGESRTVLVGVNVLSNGGGTAGFVRLTYASDDGASVGSVDTRIEMEVVPHGTVC